MKAVKKLAAKARTAAKSSDEPRPKRRKLPATDENVAPEEEKPKTSKTLSKASSDIRFTEQWTPQQLLADIQNLDERTSANIIRLFDEDNTIPFICRYRRELTGDIDADR